MPDELWERDHVAKVGGKIFAFLSEGGLGVKSGATADEAGEWRQRYPDTITVMVYIGRYGWNSIMLDGTVPDDELLNLSTRPTTTWSGGCRSRSGPPSW